MAFVLCWRTGDLLSHCARVKERTECENYRGISLLGMVGKNICRDPSRVCEVTKGLIDDEQGGIRARRGFVDQIFILK